MLPIEHQVFNPFISIRTIRLTDHVRPRVAESAYDVAGFTLRSDLDQNHSELGHLGLLGTWGTWGLVWNRMKLDNFITSHMIEFFLQSYY